MERSCQPSAKLRQPLLLTILLTYLLPILYFVMRSTWVAPSSTTIQLLSTGFIISIFGTLTLVLMLKRWEQSLTTRVEIREVPVPQTMAAKNERTPDTTEAPEEGALHPDPLNDVAEHQIEVFQKALAESQNKQKELAQELKDVETKMREVEQEKEQFKIQAEQMNHDIGSSKQGFIDQLQDKDNRLEEYEKTITEQKEILEQNRQMIHAQENKIRDLSYEVKTLLQLGDISESPAAQEIKRKAETHPVLDVVDEGAVSLDDAYRSLQISSDKQVHSPFDASLQLQKCLDIAHQIKGAAHRTNNASRFQDLSVNTYSIDLRRLFDSFHNESSSIIFLYSPKENKVLMTTHQIKSLLGWTPEKFSMDFFSLIEEGRMEWSAALEALRAEEQAQVKLMLKGKTGEDNLVFCHLGKITQGAFNQHLIGLIYPA